MLLLMAQHLALWPEQIDLPLRVVVLSAVLLLGSRNVVSFRMSAPLLSIGLGVAVFVIWIAPDVLIPGYRQSVVFQNAVTGTLTSSMSVHGRTEAAMLFFRSFRAIVLVPIIEELFWRGWLMRWLMNPRFETVPLGAWSAGSFWITAILFGSEHGPFWDVGLIAGLLYNWWMIRTRSLGDCILAHAVTNACLCAYIIATHQWQYWL